MGEGGESDPEPSLQGLSFSAAPTPKEGSPHHVAESSENVVSATFSLRCHLSVLCSPHRGGLRHLHAQPWAEAGAHQDSSQAPLLSAAAGHSSPEPLGQSREDMPHGALVGATLRLSIGRGGGADEERRVEREMDLGGEEEVSQEAPAGP